MSSGLPHLNVATIGHVEHGKTTVAAAILRSISQRTGQTRTYRVADIARGSIPRVVGWNETVQVNHIGYPLPGASVSHADCPGRRRGLRNTARGLHLIDVVVLVVAADEGIMAQSREHLLAARGAGVPGVVVFINKCDLLTEPDVLDLVESETREMISDCGYEGDDVRVVRGAALPALNKDKAWVGTIDDLIEALDRDELKRARTSEGPVLFAIDHLYSAVRLRDGTELNFRVAGMVHRGRVESGSKLQLLSSVEGCPVASAQILEMEVFHESRREAIAGENVGLVIHVITKAENFRRSNLRRAVLVTPGSQHFTRRASCDLKLFTAREGGRHTPIVSGHQPTMYIRHQNVQTQIDLPPGRPGVLPGERVEGATLTFVTPVVIEPGMTFSMADGSDGLRIQLGGAPRWGGLFATGKITALLPDVEPAV